MPLVEATQTGLTSSEMARPMRASGSQLDSPLDPDNDKIELDIPHKAAAAVVRCFGSWGKALVSVCRTLERMI